MNIKNITTYYEEHNIMKNFIVSEEELEKLVGNCFKNSATPPEYDYVDELIHDKQPVEEIEILDASLVGSINYPREDSKQIKIFIQEVQK